MLVQRQRRLWTLLLLLVVVGVASGLVLYALRQNVNLYYTPQQLLAAHLSRHQVVRLGGFVLPGSVQHIPDSLAVSFVLTDGQATISVHYTGILPALFREGQGIVAEGQLKTPGLFMADQVLAKHDANYHPPELPATALSAAVTARSQPR